MPRWLSSMFGSDYNDDRYRTRRRRIVYTDGAYYGASGGRIVTSTSQVCASCGKFRSPSWSARHPLRYGEVPKSSICRRCSRKSTSSEEPHRHSRKRHRHHHHSFSRHHPSDCTDDPCSGYESKDPCGLRRRYKSDSLGYIRPRSLVRSGSAEPINIIIKNDGPPLKTRLRTISSSDDLVRITRRISYDRPVRRRVVSSVSSSPSLTDEILEDVLPRRRSLSRSRPRSRSSVHFVDEISEPQYRRRPRSLSRHRTVEEVVSPRHRSSSRRRRPIYYDGAADTLRFETSSAQGKAEDVAQDLAVTIEGPAAIEPIEKLDIQARQYFGISASTKDYVPIATEEAHLAPKSSRSSSERRHCYTDSPRSAFSHDCACTPLSRHTSYENLRQNREPISPPGSLEGSSTLPSYSTPSTSFTSSLPDSTALEPAISAPENPDHPDHLAYLMSTAQITPQRTTASYEISNKSFRPHAYSYDTPPVTPVHSSDRRTYKYAKSDADVSKQDGGAKEEVDGDSYHERATADTMTSNAVGMAEEADEEFYYHDRLPGHSDGTMHEMFEEEELEDRYYETEVNYEAEGRAYLDFWGKWKAEKERGSEAVL